MPYASRVTPRHVRAAAALVEECRDLGADSLAWETHLIEGLRALVNAKVGIVGNMRHFASGRTESVRSLRLGWDNPDAERAWLEYVERTPVERTPEYALLSKIPERLITRLRDQIWPREAWYRSAVYNDIHKRAGIDDYIISLRQQPGVSIQHSIWMHRAVDAPPFTRCDWWTVHYVHEQLGKRIGAELAAAIEPQIRDLTPRQRDVLDLLLDGDAEKEIARTLGIQRSTAHEHILAVYRFFSVRSRAELMTQFVGRARPERRPATS